jgi:hypothetical protein
MTLEDRGCEGVRWIHLVLERIEWWISSSKTFGLK